jgi:hypothetical protein
MFVSEIGTTVCPFAHDQMRWTDPIKLIANLLDEGIVSSESVPRIIFRIHVFEAQRTNGRYLGDVLTGAAP